MLVISCGNSSVVRSLSVDHMASGSNSPSAKFSLRVRRVDSPMLFQVYENKACSHREEDVDTA